MSCRLRRAVASIKEMLMGVQCQGPRLMWVCLVPKSMWTQWVLLMLCVVLLRWVVMCSEEAAGERGDGEANAAKLELCANVGWDANAQTGQVCEW